MGSFERYYYKEPKAQKAPIKESEAEVLYACKRLLTFLQAKKVLVFRRIHVTAIMRNGRPAANPDMQGLPDLMVWIKNGPMLSIELKSTKGKKSANQKDWENRLKDMGHHYHEIRSIKELEELLKTHDIEA